MEEDAGRSTPRSRWVVVREGHYDPNWQIECTVFECPRMLLRDLVALLSRYCFTYLQGQECVFSELKEHIKCHSNAKVLLIPTFQPRHLPPPPPKKKKGGGESQP